MAFNLTYCYVPFKQLGNFSRREPAQVTHSTQERYALNSWTLCCMSSEFHTTWHRIPEQKMLFFSLNGSTLKTIIANIMPYAEWGTTASKVDLYVLYEARSLESAQHSTHFKLNIKVKSQLAV